MSLLRSNDATWQAMVDTVPGAILYLNPDRTISRANRLACGFARVNCKVVYHGFQPESGGGEDYATELDL